MSASRSSAGTNRLAIASLVVSIVSLVGCAGLTSVVGALLGHRARRQVRETGEPGDGVALAGVVLGWIGVALLVAVVAVVVVLAVAESGAGPCNPDAAGCR